MPKTLTVDDSEVREALAECVGTIVNAIRVALEQTPPELSADSTDHGIVLTGGGALFKEFRSPDTKRDRVGRRLQFACFIGCELMIAGITAEAKISRLA
jgi:actin-like ATPase involved in cell morphogenesis